VSEDQQKNKTMEKHKKGTILGFFSCLKNNNKKNNHGALEKQQAHALPNIGSRHNKVMHALKQQTCRSLAGQCKTNCTQERF